MIDDGVGFLFGEERVKLPLPSREDTGFFVRMERKRERDSGKLETLALHERIDEVVKKFVGNFRRQSGSGVRRDNSVGRSH